MTGIETNEPCDIGPITPEVVAPTIELPPKPVIWELLKTLRGPGLNEVQIYRPMTPFVDAGDFAKRMYLGRASTPLGWVEFSIDNAKDEYEAFAAFPGCAQQAFGYRLKVQMEFNAEMQNQAAMSQLAAQRISGQGMKHNGK